jgi:ketosteroid isomerase-like protein
MTKKEQFQTAEAIWAGTDNQTAADNYETIRKYYEYANAGKWDAWCDLFTDDMVMDEQLAGNIVGLATLRPMMAGMGQAYAKFQNVLKSMVVEGDEGAVVSHISALAAKYPTEAIEADVMNFFRFRNGKISYMRNVHDSKPFAPFLRQISGG